MKKFSTYTLALSGVALLGFIGIQRRRNLLALIPLFSVIVLTSSHASATSLLSSVPAATITGSIDGTSISAAGSYGGVASFLEQSGVPLSGIPIDTASVSAAPLPTISLATSSILFTPYIYPGLSGLSGTQGSNTELSYSVEFLGPQAKVPIQVNALLQTSQSASPLTAVYAYSNYAAFGVMNGATVVFADDASGNQTVTDNQVWTAQTGVVCTVVIEASSQISYACNVCTSSNGAFGSLHETAMVDPTFQIASSISDPQNYSIVISDGVGNGAANATPEPTSIALFASGIGVVLWRRAGSRKVQVNASAPAA
jgi:hypothetical protein